MCTKFDVCMFPIRRQIHRTRASNSCFILVGCWENSARKLNRLICGLSHFGQHSSKSECHIISWITSTPISIKFFSINWCSPPVATKVTIRACNTYIQCSRMTAPNWTIDILDAPLANSAHIKLKYYWHFKHGKYCVVQKVNLLSVNLNFY